MLHFVYHNTVRQYGARLDGPASDVLKGVLTAHMFADLDMIVFDCAHVVVQTLRASSFLRVNRRLADARVTIERVTMALREAGAPREASEAGLAYMFDFADSLSGGKKIELDNLVYGAVTSPAPSMLWLRDHLRRSEFELLTAMGAPEQVRELQAVR